VGVRRTRSLFVIGAVSTWIGLAGCLPGEPAPIAPTDAQELQRQTLAKQLADPARSDQTKREAASLLLGAEHPGAVETLTRLLGDASNPSAQAAIAQAIIETRDPREVLIPPLAEAVREGQAPARQAAARALATYAHPKGLEELVGIAKDRREAVPVRLTVVSALRYAFDKEAVRTLIGLLDDPEPAVRGAALQTLPLMVRAEETGDAEFWRQWWRENRRKSWSEWAEQWARGLAERNRQLRTQNEDLSARLARTMSELYQLSPPPQRDAVLLRMLSDPVADVRLEGAKVVERQLSANEEADEQIRNRVREMIDDPDPRVRRVCALLLANHRDDGAVDLLLRRLEKEDQASVRCGILTALGQVGGTRAASAVIERIGDDEQEVAAAAAGALSKIAEKNALNGETHGHAVDALVQRYRRTAEGADGPALREALLTAMGQVKDEAFVEPLRSGLSDEAATVRLAAVKGLSALGTEEAVDRIVPLLDDPDRGVRQAAILAMGTHGGIEHLDEVLARARTDTEVDPAVRQQAWQTAMQLLKTADAEKLAQVERQLADRPETVQKRIEILRMLVQAVKGEGGEPLIRAKRRLGQALLEADRPSEAAAQLDEAYALVREGGGARAQEVWGEWVRALLAADDPAAVKAIADQSDPQAFAEAVSWLHNRLVELVGGRRYAPAILLASEALEKLPERLDFQQREGVSGVLAQAREEQAEADRQQVSGLVAQLTGSDSSAAEAAAEKLQAMGPRAIRPLLEELRTLLSDEQIDTAAKEQSILTVLGTLWPESSGYDPTAPREQRRQTVETWLEQF